MFQALFYRFKIFSSQRVTIFWSLLFPILLSTLFSVSFGNITVNKETIKTIPVAIIDTTASQSFKDTMNTIKVDETSLFKVTYVSNINEGNALLQDKSVEAVIDGQTLIIVRSTISTSIIEGFMNRYIQMQSTIEQLMYLNPSVNPATLNPEPFIEPQPINSAVTNPMVISFYSVIAMALLYGSFFGVQSGILVQANLSNEGARLQVSPYSKWKIVVMDIMCSWFITLISAALLITYQHFVLSINFGPMLPIVMVCSIGSLLAVLLGYTVAICFKFNENTKISMIISLTMAWSFLSGMMSVDIKRLVDLHVPWLNFFNPVALITDSFYRLFFFDGLSSITTNLAVMALYVVLLIIICIVVLGRTQYDSL